MIPRFLCIVCEGLIPWNKLLFNCINPIGRDALALDVEGITKTCRIKLVSNASEGLTRHNNLGESKDRLFSRNHSQWKRRYGKLMQSYDVKGRTMALSRNNAQACET